MKASVKGQNLAEGTGKEEMSQSKDKKQTVKGFGGPDHETF